MAKILPGYQYEMDSTKDLLINRAIKILIDVGMLKVTATIYCIANHAYYRFVFFSDKICSKYKCLQINISNKQLSR